MSKVKAVRVIAAMMLVAGLLAAGFPTHEVAYAAEDGGNTCPYVSSDVQMEVVSVIYVEKVESTNGVTLSVKEDKDKYRIAIVTVKVTKPAGESLTVCAADLTLHYRYGDSTDVAPCEALSAFSSVEDTDRPFTMFSGSGPGWVKQTTGTRSAQSEVVYFDAVFQRVEPTAGDMWMCLGKPIATAPFKSSGWKP